MIAIEDSEDFHRYTRARFVCDETRNMAKRYISFDIQALQKIAVLATGSKCCVKFEKLAEGQQGKAFLLTMNDGREVVAKLPNPCGGRPHFTIASEVATMDYVSCYRMLRSTSTDRPRRETSLEYQFQKCIHGARTHKNPQ